MNPQKSRALVLLYFSSSFNESTAVTWNLRSLRTAGGLVSEDNPSIEFVVSLHEMFWKKTLHVFLAVLLLITTTGISLSKHYCMGRLKSVAVYVHADNCSGGDFSDPMPCCEDTSEVLQVTELQTVSFDFDGAPLLLIMEVIDVPSEFVAITLRRDVPFYEDAYPPPDLVLAHQNFRI